MKIAVLDDYQDVFRKLPCFARLREHEVVVFHEAEKDLERQAARLKDVEALVLNAQRSAIPRALIARLTKLKLVVQMGSLKDHLDLAACSDQDVVVSAEPSGISYSTAELTWALILGSVRHLPFEVEQLKRGRWQSTEGLELRDKTLGVYSLGKIGSCVAQVGKAFGMKVLCWGRVSSLAKARAAGYEVAASRAEFFERVDILSLNLRYNADTHGSITAGDLVRMKPTSLFVNTSRALLVQEGALAEALRKGRPGFAAIDVYEDEPVLGGDHPLLALPNCLCTPHLGGAVRETNERRYNFAVDCVLGFAAGAPLYVANPEVQLRG